MTNQFGNMKNIAEIGDIITVVGYGDKVFQVEGWTHELSYSSESVDESIIYDVTDLQTAEFLIAFQEDISVKCDSENADQYLQKGNVVGGINYAKLLEELIEEMDAEMTKLLKGAGEMYRNPHRELSKAERIDRLLMEISDYRDLICNFGDKEGDYTAKIDAAKAQLKELTGGK